MSLLVAGLGFLLYNFKVNNIASFGLRSHQCGYQEVETGSEKTNETIFLSLMFSPLLVRLYASMNSPQDLLVFSHNSLKTKNPLSFLLPSESCTVRKLFVNTMYFTTGDY